MKKIRRIQKLMCGDARNIKPQISILMAVYNPQMDWLREQLLSLESQDYPNIRLYIRDDCSNLVDYSEIEGTVSECIKSFPCYIQRNSKNLGSNGTFELLTAEADGEYFAYCDQDDVWLPQKLTVLQNAIEKNNAELVCSDMVIIDDNGKKVADSITKVRRHHVFRSGESLAKDLIVSNWVTGCTMLVRAERAKAAIPFCPYMVHDQYLALCCAEKGTIISLRDRLIKYRIHSGNQTLMMTGVKDRESYRKVRIELMKNRAKWLSEHFNCGKELKKTIDDCVIWACAREKNWCGFGGTKEIIRYWSFSPLTSFFELLVVYLPDFVFDWAINLKKKNVL